MPISPGRDRPGRSHSFSFDQRRRPETLRTAMATAFFCPTSTTRCLPTGDEFRRAKSSALICAASCSAKEGCHQAQQDRIPLPRAVAGPARAPAPLRTRTRPTRLFDPFALRAASIDRADAASSCSSAKTCPHFPHIIVTMAATVPTLQRSMRFDKNFSFGIGSALRPREKRKSVRHLHPAFRPAANHCRYCR